MTTDIKQLQSAVTDLMRVVKLFADAADKIDPQPNTALGSALITARTTMFLLQAKLAADN